MINRLIQMKRLKQRGIVVSPYIDLQQKQGKETLTANAGFSLRLRFQK